MSTADDADTTRSSEIKRWIRDIETAQKRERDFRQDGKRIIEMYDGSKHEDTPYNICYSNTAILSPSLYGNVPRPVVQRRFKDADPLGKAASDASTRMLSFLLDTNSEEYDDFDSTTKETVLDACLPGRGVSEFCYHGETAPGPAGPDGKLGPEQLVSECVYPEHAIWNRWTHGYAKKWQDVPWISFELYFDKPEAEKEFGVEKAAKLSYVPEGDEDKDKKDSGEKSSDRKVARVFKVWDKRSRRVLFISDKQEDFLKELDDPYELTGFFPIPKPLRLIPKSGDLMPSALYLEYENQATELNSLTLRINALIKMCKVRGVYDASIKGIEDALKSEDGDLTPTAEATTMTREGGLDKHIWLMPLEKIIAVIQQLYVARQQCKQVIYEISGISDIMRGATVASETLGAQELKSQYGTLRLKDMQKAVSGYCRDSMRIMLEIAVNMFSPETWMRVTGLPYLTDEQAMQAQAAYQQAMAQAMQAQQPPPPPPQLPPKWSDVLGVLKDSLTREYKIDVETNSTIDPDSTEQKKNLAEMMNAIAQFLNGVGPLVQEGVLDIGVAKAILLGITRQYEMGGEVEDLIRAMQVPPKPPEQDKTAEIALKGQLQQSELEKQGLQQMNELQKKEIALNARDADLKVREAKVSASEELHRIQMGATKSAITNDHKVHLSNVKQVSDAGVAKVAQLAKEIDMKMKADAQSRATEKAAGEKVAAAQTQAASQSKSLEGLVKELTTAVQAMTKATLTPKKRTLGKDAKGNKTMTEEPT